MNTPSCFRLAIVSVLLFLDQSAAAQRKRERDDNSNNAWLQGPIVWNQAENADGLLVGVRMHPSDGKLRVGQPLEIQYVLKNCTERTVELTLTSPVKAFSFDLRSGNTLMSTGRTQSAELFPTRIASGEVFDEKSRRTTIQTLGLPEGEYVLPILNVLSVSTPKNRTTSRSIGFAKDLRFQIEGPDTTQKSEADSGATKEDQAVFWGEEIAGVQLGAQLVQLQEGDYAGRSGPFHINEEMELQLRIRNSSSKAATLEISQPPSGQTWRLTINDPAGRPKNVERPERTSYEFRPNIRLHLDPGESQKFTSTPVKTAYPRGDSTIFKEESLDNARLILLTTRAAPPRYTSAASSRLQVGGYAIQVEVRAKHLGSDFTLVLKSGEVPFRIAKKPTSTSPGE
ncbi:MAG TPA: hypothetical protein DDW52_16485 [Planctomycetaceae bacterium]|nr:hypothetical protein [Planctomycetaceae bacterium]